MCWLQVGKIEKVLVTEVSRDDNYYVGHNKSYDQVCCCCCCCCLYNVFSRYLNVSAIQRPLRIYNITVFCDVYLWIKNVILRCSMFCYGCMFAFIVFVSVFQY